jgi:type IV pilus assembly protein PilE
MLRHMNKGFTLIELMIAVALVAILAAIAYPSYQEQVLKTRRSDGQSILLELAGVEEQFFTRFNTYTTTIDPEEADCTGEACGLNRADTSSQGHYTVTAAAGTTGISTSFILTATPVGPQTGDAKCANLTLTSTGVKSATGTAADPAKTCW